MAETPENPKVETGGGAEIQGSVHVNRDANFGTIIQQAAPEEKIDGKPSIPRAPVDFVGREAELETLCQSVTKGAIITGLHGLGGIGKTALALKAAERLQPNYPDGGIYLDLHGPDPNPLTPEQALEHIIRVYFRAAQLPERLEDLQITYTQALSGKRLLLLLDNARNRAQVAPLLDVLPNGCLALVTSRVHFYYPGMQDQHLDVLPEADAVKLLQEIAPQVGEQAGALAAACGYLPLALHVIGGLLHEQVNRSPQDVLAFMQDATTRLKMTTLDASLELSYQMLPEHLREPWRKLAVFAGDFDEWAAANVWRLITNKTTQEENQQALGKVKQTLGELITYSLVEYKDERYRLHDLARLFAAGKMAADEDYTARLIHAQYYFLVLFQCDSLYKQGGDKTVAGLALFDRQRREISAGWAWAAGSLKEDEANKAAEPVSRMQLCCYYPNAGAYVLELRLHPRERIRWLEQALSAARRLNDRETESAHLNLLGLAYADLGEVQRAIGYYEQVLMISRETGNRIGVGSVLGNLGNAYSDLGEEKQAIGYYEQVLMISREAVNRNMEGGALNNLGLSYCELGEMHRAIEYFDQAIVIDRETGDQNGMATDLGSLGLVYRRMGQLERAITYYEQALAISREIGDRRVGTRISWNLGKIREEQGDLIGAVALMQELVDYERELGYPDAEKDAAEVDAIRARMAGASNADADAQDE